MLASRTCYALVTVGWLLAGCGTNFAGGGGGGTGGTGPASGSGGSNGTRGPTTITTGTSGDTSVTTATVTSTVTSTSTSTATTTVSGTGGASSSVGTGGATVSSSVGVGGATVSTTSVVTSTSTGGTCSHATCLQPFICCGDVCVNPNNDILNCGGCGAPACGGLHPYCDNGHCAQAPCGDMFDPDAGPPICAGTQFCCAESCCNPGEICCDIPEGAATGPRCVPPVNGTCPTGCPNCP